MTGTVSVRGGGMERELALLNPRNLFTRTLFSINIFPRGRLSWHGELQEGMKAEAKKTRSTWRNWTKSWTRPFEGNYRQPIRRTISDCPSVKRFHWKS